MKCPHCLTLILLAVLNLIIPQVAQAQARCSELLLSSLEIGIRQNERLQNPRELPFVIFPKDLTMRIRYGNSKHGGDPKLIDHGNSKYVTAIRDISKMAELTVGKSRFLEFEGPEAEFHGNKIAILQLRGQLHVAEEGTWFGYLNRLKISGKEYLLSEGMFTHYRLYVSAGGPLRVLVMFKMGAKQSWFLVQPE